LFFAFARHPGERRDPVFDFAVRIEGKGQQLDPGVRRDDEPRRSNDQGEAALSAVV
jgi:hypothetical protein